MFGPLQARPSCLCEHLSQAPRPHGRSLLCANSRVAPHEAVPLVDETVEDPLHRTSHSPNQGVAQLLLHPLYMARPHFSPQWSQTRYVSPSPHGYDRHNNVRLELAFFEGRPAYSVWTGEFLSWHMNCLELKAVFLALIHFLPFLRRCHVIVRTDNMAVVSHINRQGGSRSCTLNRLAFRLLLWSQDKFLSLRAVHVPGVLNLAADFLSRQKLRPGE